MGLVSITITELHKGRFLHRGHNFEECLYSILTESKTREGDFDDFYTLWAYILERMADQPPAEAIGDLVTLNLSLTFPFAKSLHIQDIVLADCFKHETKMGKLLIKVIEYAKISFILQTRKFISPDHISLFFEPCHALFEDELMAALSRPSLIYYL